MPVIVFAKLLQLSIAIVGLGLVIPLGAATPGGAAERNFNLPAGDAATTLKLFARQAQRQVLFSAERVAGVTTRAVHDTLTPRDALDRLVAGTSLFVVEDSKSAAFLIDRKAGAKTAAGERNGGPSRKLLESKRATPVAAVDPAQVDAEGCDWFACLTQSRAAAPGAR